MTGVEVRTFGIWQIATVPGKVSGYMAWAKMGPANGFNPSDEPGIWFEFGATRDEATDKLLTELGLSRL